MALSPQSSEAGLGPERRVYRRYPLEFAVEVWPDAEDAQAQTHNAEQFRPRRAVLDNLSLSGLFFFTGRAYPLDAVLWVRVRLGLHTHEVKGVVRRTTVRNHAGQHLHGCGLQFVRCPQTSQFIAAVAVFLEQNFS